MNDCIVAMLSVTPNGSTVCLMILPIVNTLSFIQEGTETFSSTDAPVIFANSVLLFSCAWSVARSTVLPFFVTVAFSTVIFFSSSTLTTLISLASFGKVTVTFSVLLASTTFLLILTGELILTVPIAFTLSSGLLVRIRSSGLSNVSFCVMAMAMIVLLPLMPSGMKIVKMLPETSTLTFSALVAR